ncbi:MAG: sulfotransferase domain-containing protein [Actinomycetota bacterium]
MIQTARQTIRHVLFKHKALRGPLVRSRYRGLGAHDAFLASYPRSGTTWLRFLLFEALTGETAAFGATKHAVPSIGKQDEARPVLHGGGRLIQTHEPFCDGDRKVVYVVRDARSVVVSEHAWQGRSGFYDGPLDDFVAAFLAGESNPWGSWGDHVAFWRHSPPAAGEHLLVVRYEDLRADTKKVFAEVLRFFDVTLEDAVLEDAIRHNSLEAMRAKEDEAKEQGWRSSANQDIRFINSGTVGGWREKLTAEQASAIEERFGDTMAALGYLGR